MVSDFRNTLLNININQYRAQIKENAIKFGPVSWFGSPVNGWFDSKVKIFTKIDPPISRHSGEISLQKYACESSIYCFNKISTYEGCEILDIFGIGAVCDVISFYVRHLGFLDRFCPGKGPAQAHVDKTLFTSGWHFFQFMWNLTGFPGFTEHGRGGKTQATVRRIS